MSWLLEMRDPARGAANQYGIGSVVIRYIDIISRKFQNGEERGSGNR